MKAAVDHLTRNMAFDLGPDKIRANAIAPGAIRTAALATVLTPDVEAAMLKHTPLGRLGALRRAAIQLTRKRFPVQIPSQEKSPLGIGS
jgi:NAD(P)-dependent dehydrogenase (short-subunit alcohol dehydrogenase family)